MSTKTKTKKKGGLPKWAIKQANGDFKKAWALVRKRKGTRKKSTTKRRTKAKRKIKRAGGAIKRRATTYGGKSMSKRRAISINLLRTGALVASGGAMLFGSGASTGSVYNAIKYKKWDTVGEAFVGSLKKNWFAIFAVPIIASLVGRALGRNAPSAGVPGAINVKAF